MKIARTSGLLVFSLLAASCAAPLMKLPAGPGAPAADASAVLADALKACESISTITAEIGVRGSVGGRRLRARLTAGLARPASARIEAAAPFGAPFFILVATGGEATLLLPRDDRVLERGRPDAVLEALAGVRLDPAALRMALTGCTASSPGASAVRLGDDWRLFTIEGDEAYAHRDGASAPWRLVAIVHRPPGGDAWRAEYRDFDNGVPRTVRFAADTKRFDLQLALSQVETNVTLGPEVFRLQVPASADPITLEELRRSGPLGVSPSRATKD